MHCKHLKFIRTCQIDFLSRITHAHVKKRGTLNLLIQKLARLFFLFMKGEKKKKKNTLHIFQV